jgi:hypothetical protein
MTNLRSVLFPAILALLAAPGAAQSTLFDVSGQTADSYGQVCDVVGDTNGDGVGEFLVGAWRDDAPGLADAGSVSVYSGLDGSLLMTILGTGAGDHMGFGSSAAGDVNGDGFADICAAADEDDIPGTGANAGSATIVSGLDGSVLFSFVGESSGDLFGWSTAAVGDVNGDGRDDVLVGALRAEDTGTPGDGGSLTVFSGLDGSVIHRIHGNVVSGQLGSQVGRAGDLNGDGRADLVGVQGNQVFTFSGADASVIWQVFGGASASVSGGIDGNGDGLDDVVVGTPGAFANAGRVRLISGADGSFLYDIQGDTGGDMIGTSVVGAGDLDGDGYGDFVAGMPGFDGPAGNNTGAARAWSGRTGDVIFTISGDAPGDRLGTSVGAGDVNGDGVPDVVISSTSSAKAKVVSFVPLGLEPFGTGTPGCEGTIDLLANGVPSAGNTGFEVHLSNAGPVTTLLIGDTEDTAGTLYFGALCHIAINPPPPAVGVVARLGLPSPDANHSIVAPLPIPADPGLIGQGFVLQAISVFPRGDCARRVATSRALRLTVQ